jgi:hypothetical protein
VAQEPATERQGVVRPGRWASRALLVLGGVAAGTAAAWAVSTATASAAATEGPATGIAATITRVTDATGASLREGTHGVAQFVGDASGAASAAWHDAACQQEATSWSLRSNESGKPRPVSAGCGARDQIGGPVRQHGTHRAINKDVSDRVTKSGGDLADSAVIHPVGRTLGAVEHIAQKPQHAWQVLEDTLMPSADGQDFGKTVWDLLSQGGKGSLVPLLAVPASPVENGVTPWAPDGVHDGAPNAGPSAVELPGDAEAQLASRLARSADVTGSNSRSTRHGGQDDFSTPFWPGGVPIAPLSAPVSGAPTSAPGGHFDGPTFGVPAWFSAAHDNAKAGTVRAGVRYMPLTPGSQPGVTPD